jgi:hypothetical protein
MVKTTRNRYFFVCRPSQAAQAWVTPFTVHIGRHYHPWKRVGDRLRACPSDRLDIWREIAPPLSILDHRCVHRQVKVPKSRSRCSWRSVGRHSPVRFAPPCRGNQKLCRSNPTQVRASENCLSNLRCDGIQADSPISFDAEGAQGVIDWLN